jgi:hypothetical protein
MLGEVSILGIKYEICMSCADITLSYEEGQKANRRLKAKEKEALECLPFKSFITMNEAAEILETSKQAFNKNSRIKRGFIYFVEMDGRKYYLKDSVLQFKENGRDGRIKLKKKSLPRGKVRLADTAPVVNRWESGGPEYADVINIDPTAINYFCGR